MESQRTFLFIGLLLVSFLLFQEWNNDYNPSQQVDKNTGTSQTINQTTNTEQQAGDTFIPSSDTNSVPGQITQVSRSVISIETDVFLVKIDTKGGDIVETKLLQYAEEQNGDTPFLLLGEWNGNQYFSQSGLIGKNGPDASPKGRPVYASAQNAYVLNGEELRVPLEFTNDAGVTFIKTFIFKKGQYDVKLEYSVKNNTSEPLGVQLFTQVKRSITEKASMTDQTYTGTAYGTTEDPYEKYSFSDIEDKNLRQNTQGGYIAFIQHYFVSAWIPDQNVENNIYTSKISGNATIIGIKGPQVNVQPNQTQLLSANYYMGPKDAEALEALHEDLDLTVDYGWLWFISQPLFSLLKWLYSILGNWGFAIIAITVIVKTLLYPLTKAQYTSMAKMRNLQPKIAALKEKHGEDKQKFGQAMMEMYRKEKVNPAGGCFPLLLQMPIFLALFYVFLESVELRHAEFGLWLTDLSAMDPYFILPVLFGLSMFITQKLQPMTATDPMQQKMMMWMPVIFSVFFLWFPSGLVLYWLVSNIISIIQMLIIYKGMEKKGIKVKS